MSTLMANYEALEVHPACLILPDMRPEEYQKLKEDVSGFGLRHPITLYQGKILDGRHRYRACLELGLEPTFQNWQGGSAVVEFVIGENLHRRHLDASQKAMVAANAMEYHKMEAKARQKEQSKSWIDNDIAAIIKQEPGQVSLPGMLTTQPSVVVPFPSAAGKATEAAAKEVGVSRAYVEQAVFVKDHGTPEDVQEVLEGVASVKAKASEVKARKEPASPVEGFVTLDAWAAMDPQARQAALTQPTGKKLNTQDNTSIDWAAYSWNPITGCNHDCTYCYARDIANRFYGDLGFDPALHPSRILIPGNHKKPGSRNNRVFTCSMADLFGAWVPREWIETVLSVCRDSPAFEFLLLTKNPKRLTEFSFPRNCWVGTTTDTQRRMDVAERIFADVDATVKWVSVEPMLEPVLPKDPSTFHWYVIGGASPSSGQPGFVPPFEWVARLALAAIDAGSKTFIKTNFWDQGRPQNFPTPKESPDGR